MLYKLHDIEKAQNDHLMSKKNLKSSDLSVIIPDYPTQHLSNFILKLFKWFKWFQFKPRFKKWRELPWKNSNRTVTYRNSCQMTSTSCDEFSGLNSRADFFVGDLSLEMTKVFLVNIIDKWKLNFWILKSSSTLRWSSSKFCIVFKINSINLF